MKVQSAVHNVALNIISPSLRWVIVFIYSFYNEAKQPNLDLYVTFSLPVPQVRWCIFSSR